MENQHTIFAKGQAAPAEYFTGTTWLKVLVPNDAEIHCQAASVTFEQGARTHWHTHPGGQLLLVTYGTGFYQEAGKPVQIIRKGEAVKIAPNVVHWHGASHGSGMTHIAVNPNTQHGVVNWLQPVTDEEYNSIETNK